MQEAPTGEIHDMKFTPSTARRSLIRWGIVGLLLMVAFYAVGLAGTVANWERREQQRIRFEVDSEAPFPMDPEGESFHNVRSHNARGEASLFAPGSQQGIAMVRALSLSVTRSTNSSHPLPIPAIEPTHPVRSSHECIPDAMTTLHARLNTIIAESNAEVVYESTDGGDACTTQSVEKRLAIPTSGLERFCEHVRQLATVNHIAAVGEEPTKSPAPVSNQVIVIGDKAEVWELPNVNAAESASEMSVAFNTQLLRLGRFRTLYDNAVNMTDKAKLLESMLVYERSTMSLQRQQQELAAKHSDPKAFVLVRLVDRDIRRWEVSRNEELREMKRRLADAKQSVALMTAVVVPFLLLISFVLIKLRRG
jgi:hypothetical protein